ncbi:type IV conjugative transfer system coupling protein TraD [Solimonas sp. SE-A11]|uniref:type IV conjugative transfer system coupling protein TraD n=1 Tax=Solimonas sp. SE-A11 TaxID=3054954 RepID=UPI00259D2464|nr:type IV conjugative transfer system coupling protein TraD [Solimonas sp. SE-A11]MDM4770926.1 type IV conjugative transfer system coupling protein TraD [Solimonas sp. SE-A11]
MSEYFDNRLRPAFEFIPATVLLIIGAVLMNDAAGVFPLMPKLAHLIAAAFLVLGIYRFWEGMKIARYRANLRKLPRYVLDAEDIPVSNHKLFLGRGYAWDQRHSQRLIETLNPKVRHFLLPGRAYRWARQLEIRLEHTPSMQWLVKRLASESDWNPVAPLPPVGGNPALHGVGLEDETDIWMDVGDRVAHAIVLGTTRVGKTRLAELLVTQDIRRGEVVIVFDPKGDVDLLRRIFAEAKRAGRLDQFHIFHLGYPEISERYNPIGEFGRITEPAGRIATQLPAEGNSAAFREFAWRFTNVVARALVALGRKPDYASIARYVTHIEPLLVEYHEFWFEKEGQADWRQGVQMIAGNIDDKKLPNALKGRDPRAIACVRFAKERGLFDPVADGLRSAFEYDKTYFDKLTASLLPLMEKLTSGRTGALLAPAYTDLGDRRPILDWMRVIRERGIVYIGLDALSDVEVASAVGNSMFADLTSVAGALYKFGDTQGLPTIDGHRRAKIAVHADEFNELVGNEFIPLLNKAGGSGFQVTAYTQTASDIEAGIGDKAKAGQISGNLNTLIMLRVKNEETAEFLTKQLPKVRVFTKVAESRVTDDNNPESFTDFVSANADRLTEVEAEMLQPADLVQLPKGQAFALLNGGRLFKLRLPLAGADPLMPDGMTEVEQWSLTKFGGLGHGG